MDYNVNFIGLTFFEELASGGRRAWMPDGRIPLPPIDPHWPSIVIAPGAYVSESGWLPHEVSKTKTQFEYFFPPSIVTFPTTGGVPDLKTNNLDFKLIHLRERDPKFELSDTPEYVTKVTLLHGTIEAFRIPNDDPPKAQYFARWTVPYEPDLSNFTIILQERRGWLYRTLTLKPGSEVSLVNTSRGTPPLVEHGDHFKIYEQLSGVPVDLSTPVGHVVEPVWPNELPVFTNPLPATMVLGCSPTNQGGGGG